MKVTVSKIFASEEKISQKTQKPYTLTTFQGEDGKLYEKVYGKFTVGQDIEGEWKPDSYNPGAQKFEVSRNSTGSFGNRPGGGYRGKTPEEIESIERQSTLSVAATVVGNYYKDIPESLKDGKEVELKDYAEEVSRTGRYLYNNLKASAVEEPTAPTSSPENSSQGLGSQEEVDSFYKSIDKKPTEKEVDNFNAETADYGGL